MAAWNHRDVTDEHVLAYVEPSTASSKIAQALKTLPVERNIAKLLANAECFFDSFMKLLSCCWGAGRTIRPSEWQLIVLRTAASLDAPYEWDVNEPLARLLSFDTDEKVDLVRAGNRSNQSFFTDRHRLINRMVYQLVQNDKVDEQTILEGKEVFGDTGVVEIIMIHGIYALLAKLMRSAKIDFDPRIPDLESTLEKFNAAGIEQEKSYCSETIEPERSIWNETSGVIDAKAHGTASALTFVQSNMKAADALHLQTYTISTPNDDEVLVKMLCSPINPLDLLVIGGRYPTRPKNQIHDESVPGYEGIAHVMRVGANVTSLVRGDLVTTLTPGLGTWRTHGTFHESDLLRIDPGIDPLCGSILKMGALPAYLLVEDSRALKPGDWIIQNAGSGVIAQLVAQFVRHRGARTISVIRDRDATSDVERTRSSLKKAGADIVLLESEVSTAPEVKDLRIVLALDAVYGKSAELIASTLVKGGTFVNYGVLGGGDSSASINLSSQLLFWNGISLQNYRSSECLARRSKAEVKDLLRWLVHLFQTRALKAPALDVVVWDHGRGDCERTLKSAINQSQSGGVGERKKVFMFA